MAYSIIAPATKSQNWFMQELVLLLSNPDFVGWEIVDSQLGGVFGKERSDWIGINPTSAVIDEDYVVFRVSAMIGQSSKGIVQFIVRIGTPDYIEMRAYPSGWDIGTSPPEPIDPTETLGDTSCIICATCGPGDVQEMRVIANDRRVIIWGMKSTGGTLDPPYFGYLGLLQSHYSATDDPNPLVVAGGKTHPGDSGSEVYMLGILGAPVTYLPNLRPLGFLDSAGNDMLETCQPNVRGVSPIPSQTLIPCVVGCPLINNTEIRGELEGVFFYGPLTTSPTLADDTAVSQSDGRYLIIDGLATGPVAPVL